MTKELYDVFVDELPNMLSIIETHPERFQKPILEGMCMAFVAPPQDIAVPSRPNESPMHLADPARVVPIESEGDWDYGRELIAFINRDGIDMKKINGNERAAIVAYVFQVLAPEGHRKTAVSAEILVEACRQVRVRIPANPSATLSKAKMAGLLDSAKGSSGYTLSLQGENFVNDLVSKATHEE